MAQWCSVLLKRGWLWIRVPLGRKKARHWVAPLKCYTTSVYTRIHLPAGYSVKLKKNTLKSIMNPLPPTEYFITILLRSFHTISITTIPFLGYFNEKILSPTNDEAIVSYYKLRLLFVWTSLNWCTLLLVFQGRPRFPLCWLRVTPT